MFLVDLSNILDRY